MANTRRITAPASIDALISSLQPRLPVNPCTNAKGRSRHPARHSPARPSLRCRRPGASSRSRPPSSALGPPLSAHALEDPLATVLLQTGVQAANLRQDVIGHGLLLLAGRVLDPLPANWVPVLDGDLGELQPLPVAHPRGAVDGDRHDRDARLERQAPDPALGLLGHFPGARATALAVHRYCPAFGEDRLGGDERVLVAG